MKFHKTLILTILVGLLIVDLEQGFIDQGVCFPGSIVDEGKGPDGFKFYACNHQDKVWMESRQNGMPKRFLFNKPETLNSIMREKNSL